MKRLLCVIFASMWSAGLAVAGSLVQIRTVYGDVILELYDTEKPITVQNFLRYIDAGLYRDAFFHRGVSNFVMQGGGFRVSNRGRTNAQVDEIVTFPSIVNEFKVGPFLSNVAGTIAMAKTSNPDSATSQFFVNTANNAASLDNTNNSGGFTVFGRVTSGLEILELWRTFRRYSSTMADPTNVIGNACSPVDPFCVFNELPLTRVAPGVPLIDELIFTQITRVSDRDLVLVPGAVRKLQWIGRANVNYTLEYATALPGTWQTLVKKVGTGGRMEATDAADVGQRYYRLKIGL